MRMEIRSRGYVIMKKRSRVAAALVCAAMLFTAAGCGKKVDIPEDAVMNYTAPAEGEEIICMEIQDYGTVKIKLFDDLMPEACENFRTLAEQGYYDGLIFHRVIADFMIQGGDPLGNGTGGESCWGGKFDGGVTSHLIHLPGALAYANSKGPATDGSQYYIVTGDTVTDEALNYYEGMGYTFTDEAKQLYKQYGGTPHLDGGYSVFGQVIEGLDIIYDISYVETNDKDKPLTDVVVKSVTIEPYDGKQVQWHPADDPGQE